MEPQLKVMDLKTHRIQAEALIGTNTPEENKAIKKRLRAMGTTRSFTSQHQSLRLLYVTPEKLAKDESLNRVLQTLYSSGQLARIVIDEAHCASEYGHVCFILFHLNTHLICGHPTP